MLIVGVAATLVWLAACLLFDRCGLAEAAVQKTIERFHTVDLKALASLAVVQTEAEVKETTERKKRGSDDVTQWVEMLRSLGVTSVGTGLKLPTDTFDYNWPESKSKNPKTGVEKTIPEHVGPRTIIKGSDAPAKEGDPIGDGITVRTTKRGLEAAAKSLGFKMKWREENGWLFGTAVASEVKKTTETASNAPATTAATPAANSRRVQAPATPPAPPATTSRRVQPPAPPTTRRVQPTPPQAPAASPAPQEPPRSRRVNRQ